MQVTARLRSLRMSPRKVRLVVDLIRGLPVHEAVTQLTFMPKAAARPVRKLLESAMANAAHNHQMSADALYVHTITADGGATFHRSMPRAHGRASAIRKRTSHINIVLSDERPPGKSRAAKKQAMIDKKASKKTASATPVVKKDAAPEVQAETNK